MHNDPNVRHPDCPDVHMGVCPKCRRLYARDLERSSAAERRPVKPQVEGSSPSASAKSDRLAMARDAMTSAQRQKRWRDKDPEAYRKWNRERMKLARKNRKSDGSSKQP